MLEEVIGSGMHSIGLGSGMHSMCRYACPYCLEEVLKRAQAAVHCFFKKSKFDWLRLAHKGRKLRGIPGLPAWSPRYFMTTINRCVRLLSLSDDTVLFSFRI